MATKFPTGDLDFGPSHRKPPPVGNHSGCSLRYNTKVRLFLWSLTHEESVSECKAHGSFFFSS